MTRNGSAPGIDDFWTTTAEPMAQPLLDTCLEAIDECFDMVAAGVQRTDFGPGEHDVAIAERASEIWSTVTFDPTGLNELGQKWQRRLHRHATPKAILASAMRPASEFHLQREMTEMAMLDQPPWRHGDRILTAFELAHSDIRSAIRQTQVDLSALFA